jgi:hypothetical protein
MDVAVRERRDESWCEEMVVRMAGLRFEEFE